MLRHPDCGFGAKQTEGAVNTIDNLKIGTYSRLFLLAGIADILASFAGFIFGCALILAAAALFMKRFRLSGAIAGPIFMAIATFVSIRTVVYLLFPSPIIYQNPNPFAPAQGLLMSPSPVFSFIMGPLPEIYYSQAISMVDLGFNSAALVLNMMGLGVLVWRWTEIIPSDSQIAETTRTAVSVGTPPTK